MASSADVEIRLRLNNEASSGLRKSEQESQKFAERSAAAGKVRAHEWVEQQRRMAAATERGTDMQRSSYQRMAQAREQLGIRSERTIQREIQRTEAAYNRLKASATTSWSDQVRAAEQMRRKVAQLTNEMGRLTTAQKASAAIKMGGALAVGVGAAGYALKAPVEKSISHDYRLAQLSKIAYASRDAAGKKQGMEEMREAIANAVRTGGGTRDEVTEALYSLVNRGVSSSSALKMLPEITKAATSSDADMQELVQIAINASKFGIDESQTANMFNMAIAGGRQGGFGLNNMARWLPRQMLAAKERYGMGGKEDFAALIALNQAATQTAATEDEAGANVQNLLQKMNSPQVAKAIKQATGKNMQQYMQDQRAKGVSSIEAFGQLVQQSIEKNPRYKALQTKLNSAGNDDERRETLEAMSAMAESSSIGQIVSDRKAMMALFALLNNQGKIDEVKKATLANDVAKGGVVDQDLAFMQGVTGYQTRQSGENIDIAQDEKLRKSGAIDKIGEAAKKFNDYASANSEFVGELTLATRAVTAFAAAVAFGSLAMGGGKFLGKAGGAILKGGGRLVTGAAGGAVRGLGSAAAGIAAGAGRAFGAGTAAKLGVGALKVAKGATIAGAAGLAGEYALGKAFGEKSNVTKYGSAAINGAAAGAMIGSIFPGAGTAIGAAVGGAVGLIGRGLYDLLSSSDAEDALKPNTKEQGPIEVTTKLQVMLDPALRLQSQDTSVRGGLSAGNVMVGAPG